MNTETRKWFFRQDGGGSTDEIRKTKISRNQIEPD
jgi:hypothetical protein